MAKIMVVDDNRDIVETLKNIMEMEGHEVEIAYNGEEFLDKVESINPDLVLLDVMMPGLKTIEIFKGSAEKNLENLKIILVTVVRFSEAEMEVLMEEIKIVDYVTKPFDVPDLIKRVKKALDS